ncbi:GntR family transcriptional regulator [Advenella kashmirensis WT001]|uniref:GntR family transcriptional regulator n=1 Tax=Advenella kashmirensis (strain DSM 17095 / LMG 22695 / WT001) TaxID=1036672 RepID=I3U720_ADVKW|nr:FCD domain-containing protein [Advenella kashmirensis]AFK60808.1 GntR family transcriptional regulator [Advenella kashmirensis WT001]
MREAVKRAAAAGLVSILPKRGVLVLEATAEALHAGFHLRYLFDQEGARLLAQQAPDRELAHLRQEHERVLEQASEGAISAQLQIKAMEVDWSLHAWLTGALNNPVALAVYDENRYRLSVMQHSRRPLPERIIPAMTEHLQIIDHIQAARRNRPCRRSEPICRKPCAGGVSLITTGSCSKQSDKRGHASIAYVATAMQPRPAQHHYLVLT